MASDGESDEDFVTYGSPLEPLEEDEPIRKPIPVQDQTVKDEKGRYKRFHGAFTGGFSAGYFNTVGSKEGWTPSTFVSSRQQKAERHDARPEDFMDEEDFSEHGIAPREITTTDDFASGRPDQLKDKAQAISSLSAPIPGDTLLEEMITPTRSSIGVQLLRKMGWKDGQGVGPRVKRRQRKQEPDVRAYGCALPPNGSEESENEDEFAPENVTFAPKDVTPVDFTPKDDLHGLGYRGLDPLQALAGHSGMGHINLFTLDSDRSSLFGERKPGQHRKGGIAGQAFGVGAMEEEDDDIYHRDAMSNYDAVLGGEEPGDGLYGWTAPQQYHSKKNDSKNDAAYVGKILEGFTLASKGTEVKTVFPPPVLPRDYRPVHYFRPVVDLSSVSPIVAQALQASRGHLSQDAPQQGRHMLDSTQRREMLGETTLQGPSSVFELLDSKDRERLSGIRKAAEDKRALGDMASPEGRAAVVAAARASALQALSSRFQPTSPQPDPTTQPQVSASQGPLRAQPQASAAAQLALCAWSSPTANTSQTFKPFEKNPAKQARYDLYISRLKQGDKEALESSLDLTMTEWERGREREEFVRAAVLYKPSNSSLSSRFTRAKHEDSEDTVEVARDQENDADDKQAAVKMKMFGKLTRETFEWHPDKLLCKRFNVPDPYPGSSVVGMPKVKRDKFSVFNFLTITEDRGGSQSASGSAIGPAPGPTPTATGKRSRWDVTGQEVKPKDPLSRFISEARSEVSAAHQEQTSTAATAPDPTATAQPKTTEPVTEQTAKQTEDDDRADEEEVRPPMDLFKAIFASSSDEKSSSSSAEESGEDEEQEAKPQTNEPIAASVNLLAPPVSTVSSSSMTESKLLSDKGEHPHFSESKLLSDKGEQKDALAVSSVQMGGLDSEEFGPRLPPPGQVFPSSSSQAQEETAKKQKHKAKKDHKHRKESKHKKKSKKHKHKGKQKKKKKKAEESDSSSDDSDSDDVAELGAACTVKKIFVERSKEVISLRGITHPP
ncbi:G patch domain-containing protein 1 isoform X1 [Electrophorus electricus]|uniref:G patch domain-containing protein 1 isoform X1 n=1 Tax=Electrophorus electricus TaxID=8005 RepID=UPI0015D03AEB|nr:G patch domain-containing protein 1 isoform X1 [Electrophorus electricus]